MKLQKSTVIEMETRHLVEMTFADKSETYDTDEMVFLRVAVDLEEYAPIPRAHLIALENVRSVIGNEIQRLRRALDQGG